MKWSTPGALPLPKHKCASEKPNSIWCLEAISCHIINQALKQDTSSYHHITPYSRKRPGLFLGPRAPHIPPLRTLLTANYTGPHHSQGLAKLDSLCFQGRTNLSNLNFPSLLPYFFLGASCQAEWGAIPSGIISQRHTHTQCNLIS